MSFSLVCNADKINNDLLKSYDALPADPYIKDGMKRFRTFSYGEVKNGKVDWNATKPFFQSNEANSYAGGIKRSFQHTGEEAKKFAQAIVTDALEKEWVNADHFFIGCHQIRVTADAKIVGYPAPEGFHHDETDFIAINLINEHNVNGAISFISDFNDTSNILFEKKLEPGQSLYVEDLKHKHYVSPFTPKLPNIETYRDIIGIAFYMNDR
ncbi:2OG-Fe dioxygenase family protein [Pseudoalteromonas sp. McH1-7]|uniref:2OG-Fe dioxygenase family protein n=1 Tax=Pseudoalteromonas peptidolytica F12-50-A1 TaxID=1315280 RepID=A0A8I0MTB6_9GAMM|nr:MULTISPECIES: 2OG-Fe dioxygenase family protein [Pseudoalteromonas]MBE0345444.1 hypothetical protein [Pseudoalteromonas peptidolytica F12-50-A1]MDW7547552.1 2OG-Fe dioxygenase family protein [Pseudoalteromonas peptidolytica]NLR13393.1 2OG-Fe dioxygenase family protein [Pseudoalteromonas peptidolytica]NUZ09766.1 2OG-Fe dioxygenase family protein [Pseudoalteromonas sp. McH1-7]RRS10220.1 hypothetical protein EAG18_03130 [Pseudoalteromonas sp. J010]